MHEDLLFADKLGKFSKVILVGPWSFCAPNALLQTKRIDVATYGEFEHTALELVQSDDYANIKGIIWRGLNNKIYKNPPRPLCSSEELDDMPFVTSVYKQFLDLRDYRQTSLKFPFVDLFSSRGCPYRCSYCLWICGYQNMSPNRYRTRSIKNVINELWWIKHNLPEVKQVFFQDDTLTQSRAIEISQAIIDEDLNMCWGGYSRAEQSYETLSLMKQSGCRTLHIGYESPIQKNLDLIQKDITVEQMKEFATNIKKLDMWTSATFMIFPWMIPEEIKFTIKWCKQIKPKRMNFIQAQGYPNTPYHNTVKSFAEHPEVMPFGEKPVKLMSYEEMLKWEQWGFKQFYLYNPRFWWEVIKSPLGWKNVLTDALGLISFLKD